MKCFVGLDVSSIKLDVCIMSNDNQLGVLFSASLANDIVGASEIKKQILKINKTYHFNRIVIGLEATSLYSFHPAMFFHEDSDLKVLNVEVLIEQPDKIKKYREAFEENKSLSQRREISALQHLTRTRLLLVEQLVRTKQPFIENIYYKCNTPSLELKDEDLNTSLSATIMALMGEDYTLDELANTPLKDFTDLIQKLGRGHFKAPEKLAKAIRGSYRLPKVQQDSVNVVLSLLAREIRSLEAID